MHVVGFLSRWFENRSVIRHSARQQALLKALKVSEKAVLEGSVPWPGSSSSSPE